MIFVTVGTQLPFDRLIRAMDGVAAATGEEVIAQTGAGAGDWPSLTCHELLAPERYDALFTAARVVVAHAGVGSILLARRLRKPLAILPRRHALGEHRNDHQLATAKQVRSLRGIHVAWEAEELPGLLARRDLEAAADAESPSRAALIARLKDFVDG